MYLQLKTKSDGKVATGLVQQTSHGLTWVPQVTLPKDNALFTGFTVENDALLYSPRVSQLDTARNNGMTKIGAVPTAWLGCAPTFGADGTINTSVPTYEICPRVTSHEPLHATLRMPDLQSSVLRTPYFTNDATAYFPRKNEYATRLTFGDDFIDSASQFQEMYITARDVTFPERSLLGSTAAWLFLQSPTMGALRVDGDDPYLAPWRASACIAQPENQIQNDRFDAIALWPSITGGCDTTQDNGAAKLNARFSQDLTVGELPLKCLWNTTSAVKAEPLAPLDLGFCEQSIFGRTALAGNQCLGLSLVNRADALSGYQLDDTHPWWDTIFEAASYPIAQSPSLRSGHVVMGFSLTSGLGQSFSGLTLTDDVGEDIGTLDCTPDPVTSIEEGYYAGTYSFSDVLDKFRRFGQFILRVFQPDIQAYAVGLEQSVAGEAYLCWAANAPNGLAVNVRLLCEAQATYRKGQRVPTAFARQSVRQISGRAIHCDMLPNFPLGEREVELYKQVLDSHDEGQIRPLKDALRGQAALR